MRQQVKITGIGVIAACGIGLEAFWNGLISGKSTAKYLPHLEELGLEKAIGCPVEGFDPDKYVRAEAKINRFPRHTQLGLAAAEMALKDVAISPAEWENVGQVPIITGTALMDLDHVAKTIRRVPEKGVKAAMPFTTFSYSPIAISESIARFIPSRTRISAVQNACCSGGDAICAGAELIASGQAKIAICGGAEAPLILHPMAELTTARLTSPEYEDPATSGKPFDVFRELGVIGEGAGYVILESMDSPRPSYATIRGYSSGKDLGNAPGDGYAWVIENALNNACMRPESVDYISTWGPGHFILDISESQALESVFGNWIHSIPAGSIKGTIGHPLGAASAIQLISTAITLKTGLIPPTTNLEFQDPDCSLVLSKTPRLLKPKTAIMNCHGIGNNNSTVVLTAD
ncbi:MAG: beta-ketoacyl synthase N-terminal-like domain-containing protein [Verrucomicrobia bacterium]|jgi:3-oxoacyl-[acyl-carrier-protein] synthase II|nr:beta-ketoacyl synthase N-terminal-like domain-containing protein [Verrucomicrobiota bacterium]